MFSRGAKSEYRSGPIQSSEITILKEVIGKLGLKALLLPDRRRILLDSETPDLKQRWSEAHEIGHDLIRGTPIPCSATISPPDTILSSAD